MKLLFKYVFFLCNFMLFSNVLAFSQEGKPEDFAKAIDILPPAPNAASIIKYGGITINKNNGAPNVNIPITSISSKKLTTAISLGYTSTGIKVDEIASRVGMGWALLAGGVITRTVRGNPDDLCTRLAPYAPVGFNMSTYTFMNRIATSDDYGGFDSEPDLFNYNFNGNSGSFLFDNNMQITPIEPNKFQYFSDFSGHAWNFKIITSDGVAYYFGGDNASEKTKKDQICGKQFSNWITTSWYLIKIVHPNGDVINFSYSPLEYTYDQGLTQMKYYVPQVPPSGGEMGICGGTICSIIPDMSCANLLRTQGYLLDEINIVGNARLKFEYISRNDCGDKLVSKITLYNNLFSSSQVAKIWNFFYNTVTAHTYNKFISSPIGTNYTPYLTKIIERSPDSTNLLQYLFLYNDPSSRPPRLSFAQDHWGYFNGINNTTLVPKPDDTTLQQKIPSATADRSPDNRYALKGLLSKIIYPTGGMDSIIYEGNEINTSTNASPIHEFTNSITGSGLRDQKMKDIPFSIGFTQYTYLQINCIHNVQNGDIDPLHNIGTVSIKNANGNIVFEESTLTPGTNQQVQIQLLSGNYTMTIKANGNVVTTNVVYDFVPNSNIQNKNSSVGGIRVKAVFTSANEIDTPAIKRYYYSSLNTINQSSLSSVASPLYVKLDTTRLFCPAGINQTKVNYLYCEHTTLFSNSIHNFNDYQSSPISYQSVVESNGDRFENGCSQSDFYTGAGSQGQALWGAPIIGNTISNATSLLNGKLKEEQTFKLDIHNSFILQNQIVNNYKIDTRVNKIIPGFTVAQKFKNDAQITDTTCDIDGPGCSIIFSYSMGAFNLSRYDINASWVYTDTTTQTIYDENGLNPITTKTIYNYDDTTNLQPTSVVQYNSKNEEIKTVFKYPRNFKNKTPYDSMLYRNILNPVIDAQTFNNNSIMKEVKTNYTNWGNGNLLPSDFQSALLGKALDNDGQITKVDANGHILEFKGRDGIPTAVIYGYKNLFPVAKVVGAKYNEAIAQLTVDTAQLQLMVDEFLLAQLNNIRTNLPKSQVTTFTFENLVGVTSITDNNNRTTHYEYDGLGRLTGILDFQNNYLKKIDYSYSVPDPNRKINIFFNTAKSQIFYCQQCEVGYNAVPFTYYVPAGKYFSNKSQVEADNKAMEDLNANGQITANYNGKCSSGCEYCTGIAYKCIDLSCELGERHNVSSVEIGEGIWLCTFYYTWSDGTQSPNYTENTSTPCGGII